MNQPWTENRKPSSGDLLLREDGRICRVKGYKLPRLRRAAEDGSNPRQSGVAPNLQDLPPTTAGSLIDYMPVVTLCGEEVPPKIVSMCVFWPTVILDSNQAPTCSGCLTPAVPR